jgi:serine/threonine-protein kinase
MKSDDTPPTETTAEADTPTPTPIPGALDKGRFVPGTVLAERYRIVGLLGKGGMGEVYRADDLKLHQPVALKFLPPGLAGNPVRLARFLNEVRVARQVSHPNVCRVHDIGEVDGQHFLSMEYVDGEDLATLLRRIGRLPTDKAVEISRQICAGLGAAHQQGVLHRDLKPANVMIDGRGKARLTDFGLAVVAEEPGFTGEIAGTPAYMSPEQAEGKSLSPRSDLYALGLVLYEIFTGRRAFKGDSVEETLRLQRETPPPKPSSHVSDLDPAVERLILRCLDKQPDRRPVSALAVSAALPGGDPLAAVLAAGETPPPEMVAAAGDVGALRPAVAWACLVAALVACPISLHLMSREQVLSRVPLGDPPAALAARARQVIQNLGHDSSPNESSHAFGYDNELFGHVLSTDSPPPDWDDIALGRPPLIHFRFRNGVRDWHARFHHPAVFHPDGVMRRFPIDSTTLVPGEVALRLDPLGNLVEFQAMPPRLTEPETDARAVDWTTLFAEMGLDVEAFERVPPTLTPEVHADTRAAWQGSLSGATEIQIRVEAAAFRGKVVSSRIVGPWNSTGGAAYSLTAGDILTRGLVPGSLLILAGGLVFAVRNLRLRRGDRPGAFRIGAVVFAASILAAALGTRDWSAFAQPWQSVGAHVGAALLNAAVVWVLYIAIEPYARRRWPEMLISWSRLLAGRFRDPRVGRDVLFGVVCGWLLLAPLYMLCLEYWNFPGFGDLYSLSGPRYFLAKQVAGIGYSIGVGLCFLMVVLLLRLVFRRQWAAVGATVALLVSLLTNVQSGGEDIVGRIIPILAMAVIQATCLLLIMRVGLLAFVVMHILGISFAYELPVVLELSAWYGQPTLLYLLLVVALTCYGFYVSLGGRPMFGEKFLEE